MIHLGCEEMSTVHISGFNAPEWSIAHYGAIIGRYVSTGIYATNSQEVCKYILKDANGSIAVVDGKEQFDKYLPLLDECNLKAIVMY